MGELQSELLYIVACATKSTAAMSFLTLQHTFGLRFSLPLPSPLDHARMMEDFKLDTFLPYQASVLAGRLSRGFARTYESRFGLTVAEWRVMAHLSDAQGSSVREIHKQADLEKSRVSRAVARLEERGLVARHSPDGDKRLVRLTLTDAGEAMVAEILPLALAYEARVLAKLGDPAGFKAALAQAIDTLDPS